MLTHLKQEHETGESNQNKACHEYNHVDIFTGTILLISRNKRNKIRKKN